jgi:hypothetical protein
MGVKDGYIHGEYWMYPKHNDVDENPYFCPGIKPDHPTRCYVNILNGISQPVYPLKGQLCDSVCVSEIFKTAKSRREM